MLFPQRIYSHKGPAGKEFDFTFQSRYSPDLVRSIPLMLSCVHFSSTSLVHSGLKWFSRKNLSIFSEVEQKSLPDFNSDIFFKLNFEVSSLPVFWRQFIVEHIETIFHCWSPFCFQVNRKFLDQPYFRLHQSEVKRQTVG